MPLETENNDYCQKIQCYPNLPSDTCIKVDSSTSLLNPCPSTHYCDTIIEDQIDNAFCKEKDKLNLPFKKLPSLPCNDSIECMSNKCMSFKCVGVNDGDHCINSYDCNYGKTCRKVNEMDNSNRCLDPLKEGQKCEKDVDDLPINKIIIEKIEEEIISSMKYIDTEIIDINKLDNMYSVGLMGEMGGGKTSINYFFRTGKSMERTLSTVGFDYVYKYIKLKDKTIKLSLMDTAGQEKFMSLSAGALRGVYGLLLVFSLTPLWSERENIEYEKADKARKKEMEENYKNTCFTRLEFWYNQFSNINNVDKKIIYLLGNKVDDEEHRIIKYKDAKKFADDHGFKYYETSAKTGKNINKVFHDLTSDLLKTFPNKNINNNINLKKKKRNTNDSNKCC